jgi:hypothetical protein
MAIPELNQRLHKNELTQIGFPDAMAETFTEAIVRGEPSIFTPVRINRETVPEGYFVYDLRHNDEDWGEVATIEKNVLVNHYGTVITPFEIKLPPEGYLIMEQGDFVLIDGGFNRMEQFMEEHPPVPPRMKELLDRLNQNYSGYVERMERLTRKELIGFAGEIAAVNDAHYYMTENHVFEDSQIEFLLNFNNPLEIVADEWQHRKDDLSDMTFALDKVFNTQEHAARFYTPIPGSEQPTEFALPSVATPITKEQKPSATQGEVNTVKEKRSVEARLRAAQERVDAQSPPAAPGEQRKNRNTAIE